MNDESRESKAIGVVESTIMGVQHEAPCVSGPAQEARIAKSSARLNLSRGLRAKKSLRAGRAQRILQKRGPRPESRENRTTTY